MNLQNITAHFALRGDLEEQLLLKVGNVHITWLLKCRSGVNYILQKINNRIFTQPAQLMENIDNICKYLANNPLLGYRDLYPIPTHDGAFFYLDEQGSYWRCFPYITHSRFFNSSSDAAIIEEAARAFALFLRRLHNFPPPYPRAPIAHFHSAELRLKQLKDAISADKCDRKKYCLVEIDFFLNYEETFRKIERLLQEGQLPLRLCHNDTKLNNVLFALNRCQAIAVIDLDTVMPGSILYDFGDFVRSCASGFAEDTPLKENTALKMPLYKAAVKGFVEGFSPLFTAQEYQLLPESIKVMSLLIASRFLTDYLNGDCYFRIDYPEHNLVRTRNQISFIQSLVKQFPDMLSYVESMKETF